MSGSKTKLEAVVVGAMTYFRALGAWLTRLSLLVRPHVAAQGAVYTVLGAHLSQGFPIPEVARVALASLVVALVVAFGFVSNDYVDRELDKVTKPFRPLPANVFAASEAYTIAWVLATSALLLAVFLPPLLFVISVLNLLLTMFYSLVLKRTVLLGNLAMAVLNASIIVFGALAVGEVSLLVVVVFAISFCYTLAQEILYTVVDHDGDRAGGLITTAVYFGPRLSLQLFRGLMLLTIVAALTPLYLHTPSLLYILALLFCTILPIVAYILPLTKQGQTRELMKACAAVKWLRLSSLLPLLLLRALL